jgi:UDP-N-acetylglucosamine:LPS N-acetylglucosamine transferase
LMASVDVIMTKPGYGTLVEAVTLHTPMVYVRRYNFVDEQPLVEYLHQYGRGVELSMDDFMTGQWDQALREVREMPPPQTIPPPPTGATEAAALLAPYLAHHRE